MESPTTSQNRNSIMLEDARGRAPASTTKAYDENTSDTGSYDILDADRDEEDREDSTLVPSTSHLEDDSDGPAESSDLSAKAGIILVGTLVTGWDDIMLITLMLYRESIIFTSSFLNF